MVEASKRLLGMVKETSDKIVRFDYSRIFKSEERKFPCATYRTASDIRYKVEEGCAERIGARWTREDARKNRLNDIHVHGRVKRETSGWNTRVGRRRCRQHGILMVRWAIGDR